MPWNLLILPLVAGYYILTRSNRFKFIEQRLDRQRLIFDSIIIGIFVVSVAFILKKLISVAFPSGSRLLSALYEVLPFQVPYIGTTFASFIMAVAFAELGNRFIWTNRNKQIEKAIIRIGNELELMLKTSVLESKLLQFTLSSGKVYVGWVKELPIPKVTSHIRIIPVFSGYRTNEQTLNFTTHYITVYNAYIEEGLAESIEDLDVDLIIPTDKVISVSFYDVEMYERFNPEKSEKVQEEKQSNK